MQYLLKNLKAKDGYKQGFTLAEVLITLAIIGIVAAITIPAIAQSTQDQELKTAWKNDYSIINQAYQKILSDNGGDINQYLKNGDTLSPALEPYFINIQHCTNTGFLISPCFPQQISELNGQLVGVDGFTTVIFDDGGFILPNGARLAFENYSGDNYNGINYAYIWVDVNGLKKPNTIGKDIFGIIVLKDHLIPMGAPVQGIPSANFFNLPDETTCTPGTTSGIACSSAYLQQ